MIFKEFKVIGDIEFSNDQTDYWLIPYMYIEDIC